MFFSFKAHRVVLNKRKKVMMVSICQARKGTKRQKFSPLLLGVHVYTWLDEAHTGNGRFHVESRKDSPKRIVRLQQHLIPARKPYLKPRT